MSFDLKHRQSIAFQENKIPPKEENFDDPKNLQDELPTNIGEIFHAWKGPEFMVYEKSLQWYVIAAIFILGMVAYALYTNAPIMAITFILIGIVGYIYSQKEPRVVNFAITSKGVFADKELYHYDNIHSFWIFYEEHTRTISLHTKASMMPFIHIPIDDEDPVELRESLIKYIPEIKQDPSLIDTIERVLHI